jgi:hypothetical protein
MNWENLFVWFVTIVICSAWFVGMLAFFGFPVFG